MTETVMDGKSLKKFLEDDQLWGKFIDERFAILDKSHTGKLTRSDLEPAISGVGKALGLPPMGSSPETDHIYTEVPIWLSLSPVLQYQDLLLDSIEWMSELS